MATMVMERRAKRIASARLRRVVQMDEAYRLGDELPTGIRRYRSKNELLSSIRSVMDKVCVLASWRPLCERCFSAV